MKCTKIVSILSRNLCLMSGTSFFNLKNRNRNASRPLMKCSSCGKHQVIKICQHVRKATNQSTSKHISKFQIFGAEPGFCKTAQRHNSKPRVTKPIILCSQTSNCRPRCQHGSARSAYGYWSTETASPRPAVGAQGGWPSPPPRWSRPARQAAFDGTLARTLVQQRGGGGLRHEEEWAFLPPTLFLLLSYE